MSNIKIKISPTGCKSVDKEYTLFVVFSGNKNDDFDVKKLEENMIKRIANTSKTLCGVGTWGIMDVWEGDRSMRVGKEQRKNYCRTMRGRKTMKRNQSKEDKE